MIALQEFEFGYKGPARMEKELVRGLLRTIIEEVRSRTQCIEKIQRLLSTQLGLLGPGDSLIPPSIEGNSEGTLMEPGSGPVPDGAGHLRLDLLRTAVDIYLRIAYPSGQIPESIRRRLVWPDVPAIGDLLTRPPFERAGKLPGHETPIYALRLGNWRYPHMKLQIQPWSNVAGFMLSVNTHDQVAALDTGAADAEAFRALQAENQRLKEMIEQAWDEAGLPTFLRYLREYIQDRSQDPT